MRVIPRTSLLQLLVLVSLAVMTNASWWDPWTWNWDWWHRAFPPPLPPSPPVPTTTTSHRTTTTTTIVTRTTTTTVRPTTTTTIATPTKTSTSTSTKATSTTLSTTTSKPASSTTTTTTSAKPTQTPNACPNGVRTRRPFVSLSAAEKKAFADGVWALKRNGKWDYFIRKHQQGMQWHMTTQFLFMHRALLLEFETELLKVSPGLTALPYWDEFNDSDNPLRSPIFTTTGVGLMQDGPLSAPFAGLTDHNGRIVTRAPRKFDGSFDWVPDSQVMAAAIRNLGTFGEMSNTIELTPHNSYHGGVGGHMGQVSLSPSEPLFYLHHAYIDLLWATWQGTATRNFADVTVSRSDLSVSASAGTVLYEKEYTNKDMIYYSQRLCYKYDSVSNNLGAGLRKRDAADASSSASSSSTSTSAATAASDSTTTATATTTDAAAATATVTPAANATTATGNDTIAALPAALNLTLGNLTIDASSRVSNKTTCRGVTPMPLDVLSKLMPMVAPETVAQRARYAADTINGYAAKLNDQIAKYDGPAAHAVAQLPTMHDIVVYSQTVVVDQVKDDYKDSAMPVVQQALEVATVNAAADSAAAHENAATGSRNAVGSMAAVAAVALLML